MYLTLLFWCHANFIGSKTSICPFNDHQLFWYHADSADFKTHFSANCYLTCHFSHHQRRVTIPQTRPVYTLHHPPNNYVRKWLVVR